MYLILNKLLYFMYNLEHNLTIISTSLLYRTIFILCLLLWARIEIFVWWLYLSSSYIALYIELHSSTYAIFRQNFKHNVQNYNLKRGLRIRIKFSLFTSFFLHIFIIFFYNYKAASVCRLRAYILSSYKSKFMLYAS